MRPSRTLLFCLVLATTFTAAQTAAKKPTAKPKAPASQTSAPKPATIDESAVRAHIEFLASDALQGRGTGTQYELISATYIAAQLREIGIAPAFTGPDGAKSYLQAVEYFQPQFAAPPVLLAGGKQFSHGTDLGVLLFAAEAVRGPLQKLQPGAAVQRGAVVLVTPQMGEGAPSLGAQIFAPVEAGAAAVLVADSPGTQGLFRKAASSLPEPPFQRDGATTLKAPNNVVILGPAATAHLQSLADGVEVQLKGELDRGQPRHTYNVVGILHGSDPERKNEIILLGAHHDHIGTLPAGDGDRINNGADDDASGVAAVLELARALASGPAPKRTVVFALFGGEEPGGVGSGYFLDHPPVPVNSIIANLGFEMMGRPDPHVPAGMLWFTGFERSNLGPKLAELGARLVKDPYPEQNFFERSDNYSLAKRGVVAHTVSSFGMHADYHEPGDEASKIDFPYLTRSIQSMVAAVEWLADSDFKPTWNPGMKP